MIKSIIKYIILIIGIILILNGIISAAIIPIHFGIVASFLLGAFVFLMFLFFDKIEEFIKKTRKGKVLFILFIIGLIFFIFTELIIIVNEKTVYDEKSDVIIVLGAGLKGEKVSLTLYYRLEKALEYLEKYPDTYVVVSGGQGPNELISEAEAMRRVLLENGVDEEKIIFEDKSTSTTENFKFSKKLLDEKFEGVEYTTCYTTNGFHVYRAGEIAEKQGLESHGLSAKDVWYMSLTNHIREFFAVMKWWLLGY